MYHGKSFVSDDETSLPEPLFETRNALTSLAIQIVSAKYDLNVTAPSDYRELIKHVNEEIKNLHEAYDSTPPDWH